MNDIYYVWNSLGWMEGFVFIACLMGLYYYKSYIDWYFKNKAIDEKVKKGIKIEQKYHRPVEKKREW